MRLSGRFAILCVLCVLAVRPVSADMVITVDYTYDTNNFFDTAAKRAGLEAAAARLSRIISSSLSAVSPGGTGTGTSAGWRIGFSHPGTGNSFQVSTAADFASDPLKSSGAAGAYGFSGLNANEWILYAGGRALAGPAGVGGTSTGTNYVSTFNDFNGPLHRGLIPNTPSDTVDDLPVWGGAISFDNDGSTPWHFDPNAAAPLGTVDLYSIALHEIGHALGLSIGFNQWEDDVTGSTFAGPETLAAFNADNGASATSLNMVSASNFHWQDNTYDSKIFEPGSPNLTGTVGTGVLQDLLMEPVIDFTGSIRRLELTNVDVAALRDLGWATVPEPSALLFLLAASGLVAIRQGMSKFGL